MYLQMVQASHKTLTTLPGRRPLNRWSSRSRRSRGARPTRCRRHGFWTTAAARRPAWPCRARTPPSACRQRLVWVQMYWQAIGWLPPSCGNPSGRLQTRCCPVLAITNTCSPGSYRKRMSWAHAHVVALDDNAPACCCCSHCCQVSGLPPGCHRLRGPVCQEAVSQSHKRHLLDLGEQTLSHLQAP